MAVAIELETPPRPGILELAQHAHIVDSVLRGLHDEQRAFKKREARTNPYLRALEEETRNSKSGYLLEILRQRKSILKANPNAPLPVEITFVRFPGEEFTQVSQNPVFFSFPNSHPAIPNMTSALDLLARAQGSTDARIVLPLIGDPDAVVDEEPRKYLNRLHDEKRTSDKRFNEAKANNNREEMARMNVIGKMLAVRILELRTMGARVNCDLYMVLRDAGPKPMARIWTGENEWIIIPAYPQLIDLVLEGGGWDNVNADGTTPEELDILLDQMG